MKRTTLKIALAALMVLSAGSICAQTLLDSITFEAPDKLVRPTGTSVNVRERPSTSAPKAKTMDGWDMQVSKHTLYNVLTELPGWWSIEGGYVSKTVAKQSVGKPITDAMLNRFFGWSESYDYASEWLVARTASKNGLVVCFTEGEGWPTLWLGKQVGDVFVFKYNIICSVTVDDSKDPNFIDLKSQPHDDFMVYEITVGKGWARDVVWGDMGTKQVPDFGRFNDKVLLRLFQDAIRTWSWKNGYFYLNSELLSGEYAHYVLG